MLPATLLTESSTAESVCVFEAPNTEWVMSAIVKESKTADVQLISMLTWKSRLPVFEYPPAYVTCAVSKWGTLV